VGRLNAAEFFGVAAAMDAPTIDGTEDGIGDRRTGENVRVVGGAILRAADGRQRFAWRKIGGDFWGRFDRVNRCVTRGRGPQIQIDAALL
jgi:hypothetical protein